MPFKRLLNPSLLFEFSFLIGKGHLSNIYILKERTARYARENFNSQIYNYATDVPCRGWNNIYVNSLMLCRVAIVYSANTCHVYYTVYLYYLFINKIQMINVCSVRSGCVHLNNRREFRKREFRTIRHHQLAMIIIIIKSYKISADIYCAQQVIDKQRELYTCG